MFEKIKKFYDLGLYTAEQVHKFVEKGIVTEEQYKEICKND
ncbi:MAG: XkdX family protein [Clostridia bacterium]|nr:XkdX family protein [Clostridia bacterium]